MPDKEHHWAMVRYEDGITYSDGVVAAGDALACSRQRGLDIRR